MTKSFTAATVLALRDTGAVPGLDEPIPGIVAPTSDAPPITPRLMLSMSAGFAGDDPWADRHLDIDPDDLDHLLATGITFAVDPGTRFEYSNLGYAALGRSIERWTGERLQTLAERQLLRPLGLARTTWTRPEDDEWARPYRIEDGVAHPEGDPLPDGALAPMGGLWSCIDDLVVWMAWLDDAFPARDGFDDGPLCRSSRRELQQVHRATRVTRSAPTGEGLDHVPERIDGGGYGFGHQVLHDDRFGTIVGHSGGLPGYGSNMRWLPGRRIGAVALANSTYAPMRLLTRRMLELLDDHGLVPSADAPAPRQLLSAAAHLVALLNDWNDGRRRRPVHRQRRPRRVLRAARGDRGRTDQQPRLADRRGRRRPDRRRGDDHVPRGRRARRHDRADAVAPGAVTGPGVRAPLTGCACAGPAMRAPRARRRPAAGVAGARGGVSLGSNR